jgi:hypothetical protein
MSAHRIIVSAILSMLLIASNFAIPPGTEDSGVSEVYVSVWRIDSVDGLSDGKVAQIRVLRKACTLTEDWQWVREARS